MPERLDDNAKLLVAVVYYLDRLDAGWNDAERILEQEKKLTAPWRRHLRADRRILGILEPRSSTAESAVSGVGRSTREG